MPYKDNSRAGEYQREWARKRRKKARSEKYLVEPSFKLETSQDLTLALEAVINKVLNAKMEAAVRGQPRCRQSALEQRADCLWIVSNRKRLARVTHFFRCPQL